jgi:hypothetical protein
LPFSREKSCCQRSDRDDAVILVFALEMMTFWPP